jgi:hypothetical protein
MSRPRWSPRRLGDPEAPRGIFCPLSLVRGRLYLIAVATVVLQVLTPTFASAALCCKDPAALAHHDGNLMECCKEGGLHICPMRSTRAEASQAHHAESGDALRPICQPELRIFQALLGTVALMPPGVAPSIALYTIIDAPPFETGRPLWTPVTSPPPPKD